MRGATFWTAAALACLIGIGANPVRAADAVLSREKSLLRKVDLETRRIHLGALLQKVGKACELEIKADDRLGPISGYELAVRSKDQSARALLEAVSRLYSFPPDRWHWTRPSRGKLRLQRTVRQEALTARRSRFAEDSLLAELDRRRKFYGLSPAERARLSAQDPALSSIDNPRSEGFFSFLNGLGENELRGVMRGGSISVPFRQLGPAQQAFVQGEFELANEPFAAPDNLRIYSRMRAGINVVLLENGPLGAHGILGGPSAARDIDRAIRRNWLLNDEAENSAAGLQAEKNGSPGGDAIQEASLDAIVSRIGASARSNVLLDRGSLQKFTTDFPLSGPLSDLLTRLSERGILQWKRWGDFLLFRPTDWLALSEDAVVGWPLIDDLEISAKGNEGYLQEEDWLRLSLLGQAQLGGLSRAEFPDAASVAQHQPLVMLLAGMSKEERAAIGRPQGGSWLDWTGSTKQRLMGVMAEPDARRARIHASWDRRSSARTVRLFLGPGDVRPRELPQLRTRTWSDSAGRFVEVGIPQPG